MPTYTLGPAGRHAITPGAAPLVAVPQRFSPKNGTGWLGGTSPGGLATLQGTPVQAEIRVLLRTESGHPGDGCLVAKTTSGVDGTWSVTGLDASQKYDVVGRVAGRNDVIIANVTPEMN